jgi:hypothetical protein
MTQISSQVFRKVSETENTKPSDLKELLPTYWGKLGIFQENLFRGTFCNFTVIILYASLHGNTVIYAGLLTSLSN